MARIMTIHKKGKELKIDIEEMDFTSQIVSECKRNNLKLSVDEINATVDELFDACVAFGLATRV